MALVDFSVDGAVALVRLNRPPVNALSADLAGELGAAFRSASDPAVRAVVVTGEPHFAAGADIKGFQASHAGGGAEQTSGLLASAIAELESLRKPTIAAVFGYALGGGLELAMGADFRYLAEDAQVGQPEIKLGIIPGAGGTQRLPRLVGFQRAKEMVFSGRFVDAGEALEFGLADRVLPSAELLGQALADAAAWAEGPTLGLASAKKALSGGWGRSLTDGLAVEATAFEDCFWTEDAKEGVIAFVEKRSPHFTGT
jgi:enoyl-CoA hydratase/carnithine racemase